MQAFLNQQFPFVHKIFNKVEGNLGCFNDVIVFRQHLKPAKFNLIYFGGDIQDYEEEMKKSSNSRNFTEWNLINTGRALLKKLSDNAETAANVFVFRADYFHLRSFANYSNFVASTDFGVPIVSQPASIDGLTNESSNSRDSSSSSSLNEALRLKCWSHTQRLFSNTVRMYNDDEETAQTPIDETLPIIVCSFSKGCIVLNQLCNELTDLVNRSSADDPNTDAAIGGPVAIGDLRAFSARIRHLIWLDGGHSGTSDSWITKEHTVACIGQLKWSCYVYMTPYQLKSRKYWAVREYEKFVDLLDQLNVTNKRVYYFQDKEDDDVDVMLHFQILIQFDTNLI